MPGMLLVNAGMSGKSWLDIGLADQLQSGIGIRSVQSNGNFFIPTLPSDAKFATFFCFVHTILRPSSDSLSVPSFRIRSTEGTFFVLPSRHRVDRVLSFCSSRPKWDSSIPSHAGECVTPPPFGCGAALVCGRGCERVPIQTRGQTLRYSRYICMYFVHLAVN
jgi:hypothetical protein